MSNLATEVRFGMPERLSRELRIFHELASVVAAAPYDVEEISARICAEIRSAFDFERALLVRYRPHDRTVHAVVQQGVDWPGDEWLLIERFPFLERALADRRAIYVEDARTEAAMPSKIIERFGVRSIVAVPLYVSDHCIGFVVGDRAGGELDLTEETLSVLTALGTVAAVFIEKADEYAELSRAHDDLRQLDQAKSDFVSIASHELRTPIAVVHGIASTLQFRGPELEAEQVLDLRRALYEQTGRLRELAEQLLDLSRLESGKVRIERERFRPRERLESLLLQVAPDRLRDVELNVDPALELETDPDAIERVVSNLVLNALRYGQPPVEVEAIVNGGVTIVVEDHGEGIDPSFAPRLFERFTRSETSGAQRPDGAGLGLSIARSYAHALGGELRYEPGARGARFALRLPPAVLPGPREARRVGA